MIILDTTKSFEVKLASAITTSQLDWVSSWVDIGTTTFTASSDDGASNSTTAVTVVSAPASGRKRQVKYLSVYNKDTAPATIIVQVNHSSTARIIKKAVLAVGATLVFIDHAGWSVFGTKRNLGQAALAATTLTDIYTVGASISTKITTISVCNRSTATTYRLSHAVAGAADNNKQYFAYDAPLAANETIYHQLDISMNATDILRAYAGSANVSVSVWGEETN